MIQPTRIRRAGHVAHEREMAYRVFEKILKEGYY
jgi:hypothetical protein